MIVNIATYGISLNTQQALLALAQFEAKVNELNFHRLEIALHKLGHLLNTVLVTAFGALTFAVGAFFTSIERGLDKYQGFLATMRVSTRTLQEAKDQYTFLRDVSERLGIEVSTLTLNYGKLLASMPQVDDRMQIAQRTFLGMAMAARAVHASGEDTRLMFYAITQMASKGTLSMEELRRQLAEKLPGAWSVAARSVGMSTVEFEEKVRKGLVDSVKFLRFFGEELISTYEDAAGVAANSFNAAIGRLRSLWMDLMKSMVDSGAADAMAESIDTLTSKLKDPQIIDFFTEAVTNLAHAFTRFIGSITKEDLDRMLENLKSGIESMTSILGGLGRVLEYMITNMRTFVGLWAAVHGARAGAALGGVVGGPKGAVAGGLIGGVAGYFGGTQLYDYLSAPGVGPTAEGLIRRPEGETPKTVRDLEWYDAYAKALGFYVTEEVDDFRESLRRANKAIVLEVIKRTDFSSVAGRERGQQMLVDYLYRGKTPEGLDIYHEGKGKDKKGAHYDIGRSEQASRDFLKSLSQKAYGIADPTRQQYESFQERLAELSQNARLLENQAQMYMEHMLSRVEGGEVEYAQKLMGKMREEVAHFADDNFSETMEEINRRYTERLKKVEALGKSENEAHRQVWEQLKKQNEELILLAENYERVNIVGRRMQEVLQITQRSYALEMERIQLNQQVTGNVLSSWEQQKAATLEHAESLKILRDRLLELADAFEEFGNWSAAQGIRLQIKELENSITDLTQNADIALNTLRDATYEAFSGMFQSIVRQQETFGDALANAAQRLAYRILDIYIDMWAQAAVAGLTPLLGKLGAALFGGLTGGSSAGAVVPYTIPIGPNQLGAQHGADWRVRGSGGIDSQLVQFAATPGERVLVFTRAQQEMLRKWLKSMGMSDRSLFGGLMGAASNGPQAGFAAGGEIPYFPATSNQSRPPSDYGGVNVTVHNYSGANATVQQSQGANNILQIDVIVDAVENRMGGRITKGRGLAPVLERTYGLGRSPATNMLR